MDIIAVIPARGSSRRLPRKNVQELFGKPLLVWSIEACQRSRHIQAVYVSSDDEEILSIAKQHGAGIIKRPVALADDGTPKIEAIRHAHQWLLERGEAAPEIMVSVQANSPEIRAADLDRGIALLQRVDCWEVFSIDEQDTMNGAIRILRTHCLYNTFLSAHMAVIRTNYVDVHSRADLDKIEGRYAGEADFLKAKEN